MDEGLKEAFFHFLPYLMIFQSFTAPSVRSLLIWSFWFRKRFLTIFFKHCTILLHFFQSADFPKHTTIHLKQNVVHDTIKMNTIVVKDKL